MHLEKINAKKEIMFSCFSFHTWFSLTYKASVMKKKKSHCILKETRTINEAKYPCVLRAEKYHKEHPFEVCGQIYRKEPAISTLELAQALYPFLLRADH